MDAIDADFWCAIENAAIDNGMRYYEDMVSVEVWKS